jgi:Putative bacterial sensory transduction regulator
MKIAMALAALALTTNASPTLGKTTTQAPAPAPQASTTVQAGLPISTVTQWLTAQGLVVGDLQTEGDTARAPVTSDDLTWTLNFNGCENQVCGDLQFGAGFRNPSVTEAKVNEWNMRNRFLKSFYVAPTQAGGEGTGMIQYDVLILPGLGVEQLTDAVAVWRSLLPAYATHIGYFVEEQPVPAQ